MDKKIPLIVAGIIFSIVALVHLLRLVYHWDVTVAGHIAPMSFSVFGLIATAILALWMFIAASKN